MSGIDREVAERVMGWRLIDEYFYDPANNRQSLAVEWLPSVEIDLAWLVVEKMRERGLLLSLHQMKPCTTTEREEDCPWFAQFGHAAAILAPTAPLAICKAALAALEKGNG